jgi:hypothetical protein
MRRSQDSGAGLSGHRFAHGDGSACSSAESFAYIDLAMLIQKSVDGAGLRT